MDPEGFFPLIVRGGRGLAADYEGDTLTLQFRKSPVAAGEPSTFDQMPIGSGAWIDRPVNDAEPSVVKQQMSASDAESVMTTLGSEVRFWKFMCSNTNTGHFAVSSSEPAFMQVVLDHG